MAKKKAAAKKKAVSKKKPAAKKKAVVKKAAPPPAPDSWGKEVGFRWTYFSGDKRFNAVPPDDRGRDFSIALRFDSAVNVSAELNGSTIIPKVESNWAFIKCNPGNLVVSADSNLEAVSRWEP